ncbi:MAG: nucleotide exchange factor GrpE [Alphaproteobacteria bacterium]|nr:nucleotide exchange factor GrpE [Alphaproteobacteria bacterium]
MPDDAQPDNVKSETLPPETPVEKSANEPSGRSPGKTPREAELEAELAAFKDKALRALAEAENTRRRLSADKEEALRYAVSEFAREMAPIADNLRRALDSINADARAQDKALDTLAVGVEMTERALMSAFERFGVKPVAALGQPMNPHLHEAMFEIEDAAKPARTVVQVLETGYTIHDRLLRPAKVAISKGGPAAVQPPAGPAPSPSSFQDNAAYDKPGPGPGSKLDEQL